jgi:hypothetical protein
VGLGCTKIQEIPQSYIFEMHMAQNLNFPVKKAQFWLVPILVLAGLFSWANVHGSGQAHAEPVKTELVVSTSKGKATKKLWCASAKRFIPTAITLTEEYTTTTIQVRLVGQASIYSDIKPNLFFATCFRVPRSSTSSISC